MATQKLKALHRFLTGLNLFDQNHMDSWVEDGSCTPRATQVADGITVCDFRYKAVFAIEGYQDSEDVLLAQVCVWLIANDGNRQDKDLPVPDISIDIGDDNKADIEIEIEFLEEISIIPDDSGVIDYGAQKWSVGEPEVTDVTTGHLNDSTSLTQDASYVHNG